jgi:hypothetical protein
MIGLSFQATRNADTVHRWESNRFNWTVRHTRTCVNTLADTVNAHLRLLRYTL